MTATAIEHDRYIPVSLATIMPLKATNFPLFIRDESSTPYQLYCDPNYPLEAEDLQRLIDHGVNNQLLLDRAVVDLCQAMVAMKS